MASSLRIKVNGLTHGVSASLDTPLLYVLHNELHSAWPALRLRPGAVWCLLGVAGREGDPFVCDAGGVGEREEHHHPGGTAGDVGGPAGHDGGGAGVASVAAGVDRRAGAALWVLPERDDDPGRRSARDDEEPVRGPDPDSDERAFVPLWNVSENPDRDPEGRGRDGEGWCIEMTGLMHEKEFSRKTFLKGGGAMVVGFSLVSAGVTGKAQAADIGSYTGDQFATVDRPFNQIDSYLTVFGDNTIAVTSGASDVGGGTPTGLLMIAAEELDADFSQMRFVSPDTALTIPAQQGTNTSFATKRRSILASRRRRRRSARSRSRRRSPERGSPASLITRSDVPSARFISH